MNLANLEENIIRRVALGDILRRKARQTPGKKAVVVNYNGVNDIVTYKELNSRVNQLVHAMREKGLVQGDKVAILGLNSIEFIVVMYACFKGGFVMIPVNVGQSLDGINYCIEEAKPRMVFYSTVFAGIVAGLKNNILSSAYYSKLDENIDSEDIFINELIDGQPDDEIMDIIINNDDLAQVMFTSGTTANPKGVKHTHLSLLFGSINLVTAGYRLDTVYYLFWPMFHIAAETKALMTHYLGGTIVFIPQFNALHLADLIEQEKITAIDMMPHMMDDFYKIPDLEKRDFSSLEILLAAWPSPEEKKILDSMCPKLVFTGGAGQTEVSGMAHAFSHEEVEHEGANYWGKPNPLLDVAILDDDGNESTNGEPGEICWRGPQVMAGYLNNDEVTQESRKFGWHHSGDIGAIDRFGQLQFIDRKKDMIRTGGENVPSILVESVVSQIDGVKHTAAIGVPHPRWGEAVVVIIEKQDNVSLDEKDVISFCKTKLGGYQVPKKVIFVDEVPLTPTQRIKKKELKVEYSDIFQD